MGARRWGWTLAVVAAALAATLGGLAVRRTLDDRAACDLEGALAQPASLDPFDPATVEGWDDLPEPARRYLAASLAPGTPRAGSVRLTLQGRFRVGPDWLAMKATERLAADGFVWDAHLTRSGTALRVWDTLGPAGGATRVWMMGLVPVTRADGANVSRSAAGRLAAELIWLPSALLPGYGGVQPRWETLGPDTVRARMVVEGTPIDLILTVDAQGHPRTVRLERWGDPDGDGTFGLVVFGANLADFRNFQGHTIPTRVSAGWGFGRKDYVPFFDAVVTDADFSGHPAGG